MPAPVAIRDPSAYETQRCPTTALGHDPVVPLRELARRPTPIRASALRNRKRLMDDISMSPRLLGYVFSSISNAVCVISATVFYFKGATEATPETLRDYFDSINIQLSFEKLDLATQRIADMSEKYRLYFGSGGNLVQEWRVYGCMAISGLLTVTTTSIVIAHFDSYFCVKRNRIFFADGSKSERNLILVLIILSVAHLIISTSRFSVGEAQANVFFSSWTNFVSCVVNYEVWRKGSGRHLSFQNVLFGEKRRHWFLLAIFATISFFSVIDFYMNNNMVTASSEWNCMDLRWENHWIWLSLTGVLVCWAIVLLHRYEKSPLVVRIFEVVVALAVVGLNGYCVAAFTGGRLDQVPCPSNLYFSVWASFFLGVWIFSTMVQEGRSYISTQ